MAGYTNFERLYVMSVQLLGAIMSAYVFSSVAIILSKGNDEDVAAVAAISEMRVFFKRHPTLKRFRNKVTLPSDGDNPIRSLFKSSLARQQAESMMAPCCPCSLPFSNRKSF